MPYIPIIQEEQTWNVQAPAKLKYCPDAPTVLIEGYFYLSKCFKCDCFGGVVEDKGVKSVEDAIEVFVKFHNDTYIEEFTSNELREELRELCLSHRKVVCNHE